MTSVAAKSSSYGNYFCTEKANRLEDVIWDIVYSSSDDPLYIKLYNYKVKQVESVSFTSILKEMIPDIDPFPNKEQNNNNQVHFWEDYWVSVEIYHLIQEVWEDIASHGFYIGPNNMEHAYYWDYEYYMYNTFNSIDIPGISEFDPIMLGAYSYC
mgnify:CR=1 FL=1